MPSWLGGSPPLPLLHDVSGERMLLRGCPPFALLFRGSPPIPLMYTVHKERTLLFGGVPPSSAPWLHSRLSRCLFGVAPYLP